MLLGLYIQVIGSETAVGSLMPRVYVSSFWWYTKTDTSILCQEKLHRDEVFNLQSSLIKELGQDKKYQRSVWTGQILPVSGAKNNSLHFYTYMAAECMNVCRATEADYLTWNYNILH